MDMAAPAQRCARKTLDPPCPRTDFNRPGEQILVIDMLCCLVQMMNILCVK